MAANLKEAIENFKTNANMFKSMFELAEKLTPLVDIQEEAKQAESRVVTAQDAVAKAQANAKKVIEDVNKQVSELMTAANTKVSKAEERASELMITAQTEAMQMLDDITKKVKAKEKRVIDLANQENVVLGTTRAAEKLLSELEVKIEKARASISEILLNG